MALPHDPYIRYQAMAGTIFERVRWIYERIHYDDTPIDIVFIGSSRTARGVISTDIEARLAELGIDKRVVNFSLPASGFDVRLALAREVLETRDVELLVFSLVEQFPRDGHQAFADLATTSDLLGSPWIVNRNLPANLARLPVRQIQLALATLAPEGFGFRRDFDPAAYPGSTIDPRIFNAGPESDPDLGPRIDPATAEGLAVLERDSAFRRRSLTRPILPDALSWVEFGIPQSYIREIAALAEAKGTRIAFLYLPFYGGFEEPAERTWLEQFGPVMSASFLRTDPLNYNDVAHVSPLGADRLTGWLAPRLAPLLPKEAR